MTRALARPEGASLKMRRRRADVSSAMVKHVTVTWQEPVEAGAKVTVAGGDPGQGVVLPNIATRLARGWGWRGIFVQFEP